MSGASADLEHVPMEKNLLQVALHLVQNRVELGDKEADAGRPRCGSLLDGTVHGAGVGAHLSLQAEDVGLDLGEHLHALQLRVQEAQVVADAGQSLHGRSQGLCLCGLCPLNAQMTEAACESLVQNQPERMLGAPLTLVRRLLMWTRVIRAMLVIVLILTGSPFDGDAARKRQTQSKRTCILGDKSWKKRWRISLSHLLKI